MRKLILKCGLATGDIVMLTAAVRDLHRCYPGRFVTDVHTSSAELWEHNPHITPLSDTDKTTERLDCSYSLINRCDDTPYHCLHGFIEFLNERLHLSIKPTTFKGDVHVSEQEKAWYSQVQEVTRKALPFWIVAAGGKYDVTIKWWQHERYQEVVNHFRGKILFVQVGQQGHHHPKLEGVVDLRGETSLRELIRLVYHSEGVLCSVTALMHLAAAVEGGPGQRIRRPCVVIGGGREPAHWEAYPHHQFIHTNGALPCCASGGCWRERTFPLRDGDKRDKRDRLCVDVAEGLPRCMEMITSTEVIRRIETYFHGGTLQYLSNSQRSAAEQGIAATSHNPYDNQPLNIHSAGMAVERFIQTIPPYPQRYHGRGIVICGGGVRYLTCAWVCIQMLRRFGCKLPVQLWYLGAKEMDERMKGLLVPLGVECIDAREVQKKFPVRMLQGWELKPYAILHSSFREVLLLDADNVPVVNPEFLFETPQFRECGAIFWPDYQADKEKAKPIWRSLGLSLPKEPEFESGQIVVDKERCWESLCLSLWFNEHSDFYYQYVHGDKETFHLAFRKLRQRYALIPKPIQTLAGTMCQHDFEGRRIFQHRNADKWDFLLHNKRVEDFWFEEECRKYIVQLQQLTGGAIGSNLKRKTKAGVRLKAKSVKIAAVMISCHERKALRRQTLDNLSRTDWGERPVHLEIDPGLDDNHKRRQTRCAYRALKTGLESKADFILFLEDDLDFNRHLRHNLWQWNPTRFRTVTLASLYNPRVTETACDAKTNVRVVAPNSVFGSQAFLISRDAAKHIVQHWNEVKGMQDIKISRLAGRLRNPILYHAPSLVQHVGTESVWGGNFHQAMDFDPDWRA